MNQKRCLIIGATSDIAKELIYFFARDGYEMDLTARNLQELERIQKDIEIRFQTITNSYYLDVEISQSVENFLRIYQNSPDVVVVAIGYLGNQKLAEKEISEALKITNINYTNLLPLLNHFANVMENSGKGTIIGISSIAGERGRKANYYYGAAKAALTQHLSGLRQRLYKSNVNVLTVKPGFIKTKMTKELSVPKLFEGHPSKVAKDIYNSFVNNKNTLITPRIYFYLNIFIKLLPEKIFRKINL